ncbi:hypothetical protein EK21DRAFT_111937 [Setomelanomma holmii]|uniref:Uncharacterized protein n=1 Tax=Setomelanomma holmii TaxID=210430 RepID=A0A9P4H968_9PLEO|nr:hypothetical protein EK21DRAFT_111937 [Setomelanomma holmii]
MSNFQDPRNAEIAELKAHIARVTAEKEAIKSKYIVLVNSMFNMRTKVDKANTSMKHWSKMLGKMHKKKVAGQVKEVEAMQAELDQASATFEKDAAEAGKAVKDTRENFDDKVLECEMSGMRLK